MHLHPTQDQFRRLMGQDIGGPVTMLNLLRFREQADYTDHPELAPDEPITGEEAYAAYGAAVSPLLEAAGGEPVFAGTGGPALIGPHDEHWDLVLLVRYPDLEAFGDMTSSPAYVAVMGHRDAALADSRLVPLPAPRG